MSTHYTQAQRIFEKCGGAAELARMLGYNRSSVYKWDYPKSKGGTDGLIPSSVLPELLEVTGWYGITITAEDLYGGLICQQ